MRDRIIAFAAISTLVVVVASPGMAEANPAIKHVQERAVRKDEKCCLVVFE